MVLSGTLERGKREKMIYTFDSRVRYSELDSQGRMTLPAMMNRLQDCSTFQSEDIGLGLDVLKKKKRAWILSYWQAVITCYPKLGEKVTTGTMATKFKGIYGERNFFIEDAQRKRVLQANSIWVFMDLEKGRPVRPGEEDIAPYGTEQPLDMAYEGRKIRVPASTQEYPAFSVKRSHIDTNGHVNNCQYIQMAADILPESAPVRQLRVDYKKSAVLGDVIVPRIAKETDRTVIELCAEDGAVYAVLEVKK